MYMYIRTLILYSQVNTIQAEDGREGAHKETQRNQPLEHDVLTLVREADTLAHTRHFVTSRYTHTHTYINSS